MARIHFFKIAAVLSLSLAVGRYASAATLASFCLLDADRPNVRVEGVDVDKLMPIASVSKVVTTWWAINELGLDYRFPTIFNVTPVAPGLVDVHISGSRDPYFGLESLQFAMIELNKKGISSIRNLTFDEDFKFFRNVTSSAVAEDSHYSLTSPSPETVTAQLRKGSLTAEWATSFAEMRSKGIADLQKPHLKIANISYVPRHDYRALPTTHRYVMHSAKLEALVKEMNRNSNNHAANQIFEHLGGAPAFKRFAFEQLGLAHAEISFVNGSGSPQAPDDTYNQASCSTLLQIIKDMRTTLKEQKKDLPNVMAVIGVDLTSTTSRIYHNANTNKAVVAKTGTVSPDITLAGLLSTNRGNFYFMYNMATKGTKADWRKARAKILSLLSEEVRKLGGGHPLPYSVVTFSSVDKQSVFEDVVIPQKVSAAKAKPAPVAGVTVSNKP